MKRRNKKQNRPSKPVDQEFWAFMNDEENHEFLVNSIRWNMSDDGFEDPEGIAARIRQKYSVPGRMRPRKLHRGTLITFARRETIDYKRERKTSRRGGGVPHYSLDDQEFMDWLPALSVSPVEIEPIDIMKILTDALSEAEGLCDSKQLIVVRAMKRWLERGCDSESWLDELSPQEVNEFIQLKKGKSLEGKVSATFTKVKKLLREIIEREGFLEN